MRGFSNETEMIEAYILAQAEDILLTAVGIVFEKYDGTDIKYKLRQSWKIPDDLYQNAMDERSKMSPSIYFDIVPFVQVQMCVDEALINKKAPDSMSNVKVL